MVGGRQAAGRQIAGEFVQLPAVEGQIGRFHRDSRAAQASHHQSHQSERQHRRRQPK